MTDMDAMQARINLLEDRADRADESRKELEERLIGKLSSLEAIGRAQIGAIGALTKAVEAQATRNELQDADLERLKETVHEWVGERFKTKIAPKVAGVTTLAFAALEVIARVWAAQS